MIGLMYYDTIYNISLTVNCSRETFPLYTGDENQKESCPLDD
jgi:hypothetical protein